MSDMPHEEFSTEELMNFMNGLKDGSVPMTPPSMVTDEITEQDNRFKGMLDQADIPDEVKESLGKLFNQMGDAKRLIKKQQELIEHAVIIEEQDVQTGTDAFCQLLNNDAVTGVLYSIETSPMHTPADKLRMTIATILTALKDYNISLI